MSKPLISIVVPVYKVEKYLERCVKSICAQTYQNLEIILVDDGSPDRCGEMCDMFAKQDSRIRVVHKENGGLSDARNAGLDIMTGDYVGFVDSDDWIEPDMYDTLYNLLIANNADIAAGGIFLDYADQRTLFFNPQYPQFKDIETFSSKEALRELTYHIKISNSVCDKLFSRYIFQNIRMTKGRINEDFEIMPSCLLKAHKIVYTPIPYYHYYMSEGSITRAVCSPSRFTESDLSRERIKFYKKNCPEYYYDAIANHIEICLQLVVSSSGISSCKNQRKALIYELKQSLPNEAVQRLSKKNKMKLNLFNFNVWVYCRIMKIYFSIYRSSVVLFIVNKLFSNR